MDGWSGLLQVLAIALIVVPLFLYGFVRLLTFVDALDEQLKALRMWQLRVLTATMYIAIGSVDVLVKDRSWFGGVFLALGLIFGGVAIYEWRQLENAPEPTGQPSDAGG